MHAGHRAAIVGRNGVGKTTLFQLLLRKLQPDEGEILLPAAWKIAFLQQNLQPSPKSALEYVMDGDHALRQVERRIQQAQELGDEQDLSNTLVTYEELGGYEFESRAATILAGLGIHHCEFNKPQQEFSGGWRIRLNLAQTLMTPSNLLLLDEPTNHLDLEATAWLRRWLQKYEGTVVTIAHDRDFLDKLVDTTIHIDELVARTYKGGYTAFEEQRTFLISQQQAFEVRQKQEKARIQRFIDRFRYKDSKAKQVQSRVKLLERMAHVAVMRDESPYRFNFRSPDRFDQPMVKFEKCTLGYENVAVIKNFTGRIFPNDRIGILGVNGAGKTTLLKALAQQLGPLDGEVKLSEHTSVGYFAQHQLELLQPSDSLFTFISGVEPLTDLQVRNYLGVWGFSGDDIFREIHQLSGGEKARLVLAGIALKRPAILVLDEPTNHLDIEMRSVLAEALNSYGGAVVIVAHDQHLLTQCVNEFWLVQAGEVRSFEGNLDEYEATLETTGIPKETSTRRSKVQRQEKARLRERNRDLNRQKTGIESQLAKLSDQLNDLHIKLTDKATLDRVDHDQLNQWMADHSSIQQQIQDLEAQWYNTVERLDG